MMLASAYGFYLGHGLGAGTGVLGVAAAVWHESYGYGDGTAYGLVGAAVTGNDGVGFGVSKGFGVSL